MRNKITCNAEQAVRIWSGEDREDVTGVYSIHTPDTPEIRHSFLEHTFLGNFVVMPILFCIFSVIGFTFAVITSPVWVPIYLLHKLNKYLTNKFMNKGEDNE